jgi:hypothetical protein
MMRVPEGQVAITINDGMTGERDVTLADANAARL